jgi:5'-nucleotidase / UDP-sugar diphosphatase
MTLRINITLFLILISSIALIAQNNNSGRIVILHSNDLHSNITGFAPELEYSPCATGDDETRGGFSRIAGIINAEREINDKHLLVLDAGDFLMGTFFHAIEIETGFQLPLMKKMGYDVLTIGNHEFDFGPDCLAEIINESMKNGEIPLLTLANIDFPRKGEGFSKLKELFDNDIIKEYHILERDGLKIGIFGLMGIDADEVSPQKEPVNTKNYIRQAKRTARTLKQDENVDLIICLSHSGIYMDKDGNWYGEDIDLANKVKDIDIIISGHTHSETVEPIIIDDTYIVQTGAEGKNIGRLELVVKNAEIIQSAYHLIKVDDNIKGDCNIHLDIAAQIRTIDKDLLKPIGLGYYLPVAVTNYPLYATRGSDLSQSNLGPFVADAIKYYVDNYSSAKADVAMIAAGVIRSDIKVGNHGVQIASDMFRVVSLGEGEDGIPGNPLARVYLTARELKNLLEILHIAPEKNPSYLCYYSGIKIFYDNDKGFLKKIRKIELNGEELDFSRSNKQLYSIVANAYMLEFVGNVKKMTFGLVNLVPKDSDGNKIKDNKQTWIDFEPGKEGTTEGKEWMAIMKYIESFPETSEKNVPDLPEKYKDAIQRSVPVEE